MLTRMRGHAFAVVGAILVFLAVGSLATLTAAPGRVHGIGFQITEQSASPFPAAAGGIWMKTDHTLQRKIPAGTSYPLLDGATMGVIYGSGTDDCATWMPAPMATVRMTRHWYCRGFTIPATATLDTSGYLLFSTAAVVVSGTLTSTSVAPGGSPGGAGQVGVGLVGSDAAGIANGGSYGSAGGAGGAGSGGAGGAAGTVVAPETIPFDNLFYWLTLSVPVLSNTWGGGGGGGGGDGANAGGAGGQSGGDAPALVVAAPAFTGTGTISCPGTVGLDGADAAAGDAGGGGGGGGSGGGLVVLITQSIAVGLTVTAPGGAAGGKGHRHGSGSDGTNGVAGATGYKLIFDLAAGTATRSAAP